MVSVEIEIDDAYMTMIDEMKSDDVSTEQFVSQLVENTAHNQHQRRKNAQYQQQQQQQQQPDSPRQQ